MAVGDEIEIATNCPEWVTLRDVYEHFRWNTMTSWEQHAATRPGETRATVSSSESRLEQVAGRMEAYLATVARIEAEQPSGAPIQASLPCHNQTNAQAMTTRDVANLLGCSYTEARERLLDGRIKAVKDGRWFRTRREWVEEYITLKTVQPAQAVPGVHTVVRPPKRRSQGTVTVGGIGHQFLQERTK